MEDKLIVRGAREHNLKDVSVELPRNSLIVFTGLSGSGKSSLAFDTIFAEGQRRYVESLSAYARQFLGQMDKPDVDFIEGLSPAVSIDCPECGREISRQSPQQIVDQILTLPDGEKFQVLAPVVRARKGEYADLFRVLQAQGFSRVRVDGVVYNLPEVPALKKQEKHSLEVVVDRLQVKASARKRINDSVETALRIADGSLILDFVDRGDKDPHREMMFI